MQQPDHEKSGDRRSPSHHWFATSHAFADVGRLATKIEVLVDEAPADIFAADVVN
jgi:hypothetical protein